MRSPDLFPAVASEAPHATWLREEELRVIDYQDRRNGGWERHSLNTARFLCCNAAMTRYASGDTPDAAEQAYCLRYSLDWWKLAEWNLAMAGRSIRREIAEKLWRGDVGIAALAASMEL